MSSKSGPNFKSAAFSPPPTVTDAAAAAAPAAEDTGAGADPGAAAAVEEEGTACSTSIALPDDTGLSISIVVLLAFSYQLVLDFSIMLVGRSGRSVGWMDHACYACLCFAFRIRFRSRFWCFGTRRTTARRMYRSTV